MWPLPVNVNVCRYVRELARNGVEGYSLAECERDYTVGEQYNAATQRSAGSNELSVHVQGQS